MTEKNKYSAVEVVKEIVKSLKPKIDNDIQDLKKNGSTFLGGTQTSGQTGGVLQGTKGAGTGPSIADQIGWNKSEVDAYVKKILSDKYKVQDVLKEVPKAMRDNVMSALRTKAGKKTYKGGLKKYMAKKCMEKAELEKKAPKGVDPESHERCVREVKQDVKPKGKDQTKIGSAHAICTASLKGKTNK